MRHMCSTIYACYGRFANRDKAQGLRLRVSHCRGYFLNRVRRLFTGITVGVAQGLNMSVGNADSEIYRSRRAEGVVGGG